MALKNAESHLLSDDAFAEGIVDRQRKSIRLRRNNKSEDARSIKLEFANIVEMELLRAVGKL